MLPLKQRFDEFEHLARVALTRLSYGAPQHPRCDVCDLTQACVAELTQATSFRTSCGLSPSPSGWHALARSG